MIGRVVRLGGVAAAGVALAVACGSRTEVRPIQVFGVPLEGGTLSSCADDADCSSGDLCSPTACVDGQCVDKPRVVCDDGDPCTTDTCTPANGACKFAARTFDSDGDGFRAALPGTTPGAPGSCGDDCNDASPLAHPGAQETCDGVDNDCNGVVDDGARFVAADTDPILVSTGSDQAAAGGVAYGASEFAVVFQSETNGWANTFATFDPFKGLTQGPTPLTREATDAFTGPLVWTGQLFASAWEDRRDGDFEIYFNRFDGAGKKLTADVRITRAEGFSLRPSMVWNGTEFLLVWDDRRDGNDASRIFAQRLDKDGKPVGGNTPLTPAGENADDAHLALGDRGLGVIYNQGTGGDHVLAFRTLGADFSGGTGQPLILGRDHVSASTIAWSGDRYVVVWDTEDAAPGPTIRGAVVSRDGQLIVAERDVTAPAPFARSHALLPLGDRLLLFWAEENGGAYSIYSKTIAPDLSELTPRVQITPSGPSDSVGPAVVFGPDGVGAVVFGSRRSGTLQVYAIRLQCIAGGL